MSILESRGKLVRVKPQVDPDLEVAEVLRRACSNSLGKAILFENVKGSDLRILGNAFSSDELVALGLGVGKVSEIGEKLGKLMNPDIPKGILDSVRALPRLKEMAGIAPKTVKTGPCKDIVMTANASLHSLPVLKVWPKDGGRFITFPLVVTRNPDTGNTNIGVYRMQVYDEKTAGMHWQLHRSSSLSQRDAERIGKRTEVAAIIGADPATIFAGVSPVPDAFDEYLFAGFVRGKGVELVDCETVDLKVPANSEIVLEGYIEPGERKPEGPFGDHTGYYTPVESYPVFHLTAMTRRNDAIYHTTVVGKPVQEDAFLAKAAGSAFTAPVRLLLPEVTGLYLPPEGVFTGLAIVSIKKRYPAQAKKVMMALWGLPQLMFLKFIIVLDDDIDITNLKEVLWATTTRVDPLRDIILIGNAVTDSLDHSSPLPNVGSKMGIDATKKWREEGYEREWPEVVDADDATKNLVNNKWNSYFA